MSAIDSADTVLVSSISAWEIGMKAARKQLEFPIPSKAWFLKALDVHGLTLADLSVDVLTGANELPWHHRDPADRFIISTAVVENCPVVTGDRRFLEYDITVLA